MKLSGEGFVLAGGRSSRMGMKKWSLALGKETLLERSVLLLQSLGLQVSVVLSDASEGLPMEIPTLVDRIHNAGPLGGVFTALSASRSADNYFLPCDAPFVTRELFGALAASGKNYDVVAPVDRQGRVHPLAARYSIRCLPFIERYLSSGKRKVEEFLASSEASVHFLRISDFNWPDEILLNVNRPEDWEEAQRLAGERKPY